MESRKLADCCIEICQDHKAEDVVCYDVGKTSMLADYYVICSGNSETHIRAIMNHLSKTFKEQGIHPKNVDGVPISHWIVMDYYDVLIHIFSCETREHYKIEALLQADQLIYGKRTVADEPVEQP